MARARTAKSSLATASGRRTATHIVVAGNVCLDRTAEGGWTPGGPALYAARCAHALGARVTLVTHLTPNYDREVLAGLEVVALGARSVPLFANTYTNGQRSQLLLARGARFSEADVCAIPHGDGLIVAPAFREIAAVLMTAGLEVVTLQGALRSVDAQHNVIRRATSLFAVQPWARPGVFAVFSVEDTAAPEIIATAMTLGGATAVLTHGAFGATVYRATGNPEHLPPIPAHEVDPTGAGDCFAAAFTVRMLSTGDEGEALRFAAAAGAIAVESVGLAALPTVADVEARLAREAA